jgi:hypothetical protein
MRIWIWDLVNPGSEIRDEKNQIRDKHPGSSTLQQTVKLSKSQTIIEVSCFEVKSMIAPK